MEQMLEKLELMLKVYREKLERVNIQPIDYMEGVRLSAQIALLENLYYYAHQEAAKIVRDTNNQGTT